MILNAGAGSRHVRGGEPGPMNRSRGEVRTRSSVAETSLRTPAAATVGAITLVAAATGTADAADTSLTPTRSGSTIGTMTHLAPDADTFRVCDKRADGHGVTG
ncbi:hypothetical protein [Streptomyces pristinaespiralis]|uniref:hypothetical protein n=1 Tax=Streptomyces pristinaespiralis TaxID=38300 RepID=UPI00384DADD3